MTEIIKIQTIAKTELDILKIKKILLENLVDKDDISFKIINRLEERLLSKIDTL